jgi:hypothetical protein
MPYSHVLTARHPRKSGSSRLAAFLTSARGPDVQTSCVGIYLMQLTTSPQSASPLT